MIISDIDADTDEGKLAQEIRKSRSDIGDDLQVLSLRPMSNGTQAATVRMRKQVADDLAKSGRIKIGWVQCRIRKMINLVRCYKCLQFGHRTEECKGEDNSNRCLKYGKTGHLVKECQNLPHCTACKLDGHRADQTRCPIFRKLLNEKAGKVPVRAKDDGKH